jgi:hypothetical protein
MDKRREQLISFGGVVALALALPIFLKGVNYLNRVLVGAEGRLAAIGVETNRPLGPMPQPWRALSQGGEDLTTFLDETGGLVQSINPAYIRIDHIYDQFDVVGGTTGNLKFDWTKLDILVDKIIATGAKPFFSLSYMPSVLSKTDTVDEPTNYDDWATLVQKTIEHYSGQKGIEGVYYEVWNEPDLFGKWTMGGKKDYKKLYSFASQGASSATNVRPFKFGGPGTTGLYKNWVDAFFPFVLQNNLRLDFYSWHRYDTEIEQYSKDVADVDSWLDSHPYFSRVEKIVSEMGPSSEKDAVSASKLGAVQLLSVTREMLSQIKYAFTFSVKDGATSPSGWGILGPQGQITPRYQALKLLNMLGPNRLSVTGEGTWVTAIAAQNAQTYQVLVSNYDSNSSHSEIVPVTFLNLSPGQFILKQTTLEGQTTQEQVATDESILQKSLSLTPNSAVLLELLPDDNPQASN